MYAGARSFCEECGKPAHGEPAAIANDWRMNMSMHMTETSNQTAEVRHLTDTELDNVNGGFVWIAPFVIGALVGYGCHEVGEWTVEQLLGE
jgi:hypothetical protein